MTTSFAALAASTLAVAAAYPSVSHAVPTATTAATSSVAATPSTGTTASTTAAMSPAPSGNNWSDALASAGQIAAGRDGEVEVSIADLRSGAVFDATPQDQGLITASSVKVAIAITDLRQHEAAGTSVGSDEMNLLTAMIEWSDNSAAWTLFDQIGGAAALSGTFALVGATSTAPSSSWGLTTTTAHDQALLLAQLAQGSLLTPSDNALLLGLMRNVIPEHRFGLDSGPAAGLDPAIKTGWLVTGDTSNTSCLAIYDQGLNHPVALSVYSAYPAELGSDFSYGADTCDSVLAPIIQAAQQPVHEPFGNVEAVSSTWSTVTAQGWTVDPDTSASVTVTLTVDGSAAATAVANGSRPDVAAAFPGAGSAHGFAVTAPIGGGSHTVCVVATNLGMGDFNPKIGCTSVAVPTNPFGNVDAVDLVPGGVRISGWAVEPQGATSPVEIDFLVDGAFTSWGYAGLHRSDIAAAFPSAGPDHGFQIDVPLRGAHQVCAYAINAGAGSNVALMCAAVAPPLSPLGNIDTVDTSVPGQVALSGWAIDPSTSNSVEIDVLIDGSLATWTMADDDRPDVGAVFPAFGNGRGFTMSVAVPSGTHLVCAYALGSPNTFLGCYQVTA